MIEPGHALGKRKMSAPATSTSSEQAPSSQAQASDLARAGFAAAFLVDVEINGVRQLVEVEPRVTLLDMLRERLHLTGTKKGCNRGECGVCTVHLDGRRVNACLVLAAAVNGCGVTTIEGLGNTSDLHPVQRAFIDHDAFQCGYCTCGQIMSAVACIAEGHTRTNAEIREWMSGNICRCSAYPQITAAIEAAAREIR